MTNLTRRIKSNKRAVQRESLTEESRHLQTAVPAYFSRKALWMRLLAALLLVGCLPIILLTMLVVRFTSPGPALFRQTRLGKGGRRFDVLKIRTMYSDAEKLSGPALCAPGDSRITPIGKLLRFLHLDELPQLINVVRGEMCLVGPRPERPAIIARNRLNEIVEGFSERTNVLPGVTGLAQINLPPDQTPECVIPKTRLDLEYIASANASMDFRILVCTAMRMVGIRHGRAAKLLRLHRNPSRSPRRAETEIEPSIRDTSPNTFSGQQSSYGHTMEEIANASGDGVYFSRLRPAGLTVGGESDMEPVGLGRHITLHKHDHQED